jgi:hypothetical protein
VQALAHRRYQEADQPSPERTSVVAVALAL